MVWTHFWDMHSGGGQKLDWGHIYIEAPEAEARGTFEKLFGRDPNHVTCNCCGEDYSVSEEESLEQASAYQRHCAFDQATGKYVEQGDPTYAKYGQNHIPLADYVTRPDVRIVRRVEVSGYDPIQMAAAADFLEQHRFPAPDAIAELRKLAG